MKSFTLWAVCLMLFLQFARTSVEAKSFVYVSLKSEDKIAIYSENETTGVLNLVKMQNVIGGPASIAVTADKSRLYVAQRNSKKISCYAISAETGELSYKSSIDAVDNPVYISLDKTGKYLFSVYFSASKMATYAIDSDGALNEIPVFEQRTPDNPHAIQVDRGNQFLYVSCMGGERILQFNFDPETGKAVAMSVPEVVTDNGVGPRHFTFDVISDHLFVVNEVGSSVTNYRMSKSGYLDAEATISTLPESYAGTNKCADIHITPDGKFLYATNRGAETIAAFIVGETNRDLTLIDYYDTEKTPREMSIDAAGKYLFAAGESSGKLQSYKIDPLSGELEPLQNISVGKGPAWVEVVKVDVGTAVENSVSDNSGISVVPNPFSQKTTITFNGSERILTGIYNIQGKLVWRPENVSAESERNTYNWSGEGYLGKVNCGAYFAMIESTAGTEAVMLLYQP